MCLGSRYTEDAARMEKALVGGSEQPNYVWA